MIDKREGGAVTGVVAHNGLTDWLLQRITASILVIYTVVVAYEIFTMELTSFEGWVGIFSQGWMKILSILASVALIYHAWVGIREIWMDYVQPVKLRIFLQIFSIGWIVGCGIWMIFILWKI